MSDELLNLFQFSEQETAKLSSSTVTSSTSLTTPFTPSTFSATSSTTESKDTNLTINLPGDVSNVTRVDGIDLTGFSSPTSSLDTHLQQDSHVTTEWLQHFEGNDTRVAMIGNVDSGKSTLVGVLTNSVLDDGRGTARSLILKHRHEKDNGRTSTVTLEIMGFQNNQQVVPTARNHTTRWTEVVQKSDHTVSLIDLCGHEKYLKTTLFGMTGLMPDYAFLIVGSNMGVQVMTREHISIACALNLPLFVAVTKVDICPLNILQNTRRTLAKILRASGKMPYPVKDMEAATIAASNIASNRIVPVFTMSSVSGQGVDLLRHFLSLIRRNERKYQLDMDPEVTYDDAMPQIFFPIDGIYEVRGTGWVVSGVAMRGTINVNGTYYIGPDKSGQFHAILIKSIECRRVSIQEVKTGQSATLAIRPVNRKLNLYRNWFKRGMVIVDGVVDHAAGHGGSNKHQLVEVPKSIREFDASILILHHQTTIAKGYQPVIHCGVIRQAAEIIDIKGGKENLKTGERAELTFRFVYSPEYILPGSLFLFREGRAKGIGKVLRRHIGATADLKAG